MVPTSTNVSIQVGRVPAGADAVACFVHKGADAKASYPLLGDAEREALQSLLKAGAIRGKSNELTVQLLGGGSNGRARRLLVVGLGAPEKLSAQCLREAGAVVARAARRHKLRSVAIYPPEVPESLPGQPGAAALGAGRPVAAAALATGVILAAFRYEEYKGAAAKASSDGDSDDRTPLAVTIVAEGNDLRDLRDAVEQAQAVAEGQNFARTIASRPGNNINPPTLAKVAQDMGRGLGIQVRVLDEKQMERLGMGGILAVGSGSIASPPRMIVLEYNGAARGGKGKASASRRSKASAAQPLLVVGKAITFDTGGVSIKGADKMGRMIYDKCGAMAVLGLLYSLARLKLPVHVVGILASAENVLSSRAYRPGDILRMYNGVTVEVTNTDAEGRLVLGDALAWGIETFKPSAVVDLATLTGGVVVALGKTMAGVMSNNDEIVRELNVSADAAGEKIWRLPVGEDQRDYIKSDMADIVNSGGREGSPLQGGAFLSFFVPEDGSVPWAHLDIAGVADTEKELPLYGKGATGWGVRTLVEWVKSKIEPRVDHAMPRAAGG